MFEVPLLIAGQTRPATGGAVFERRSPFTGETVSRVAAATLDAEIGRASCRERV